MSFPRTIAVSALLVALLAGVLSAGAPHRAVATTRKTTARPIVAAAPDETQQAEAILGNLRKTYRYLDGVTVAMGSTPNGYQAVSYYTTGQIVVNKNHSVPLDEILAHEIWHIIDYRDNGRIDWGENLPPSNTAAYHSRY